MAYTAGTGFRFWRTLSGAGHAPAPLPFRIANSTTLRIGDAVRVNTAGFLVTAAAGAAIAGVLQGFVDESGIPPNSLGYSRAALTLTGDDTVATSATNQTRADYLNGLVQLDPQGDCLWLNDADADQAQTNVFQFFDSDSNGRQVTQSTALDTNGQWQLILWDPKGSSNEPYNPVTADASMGAYRINENQFSGGLDSATAKNAA